MEGKGKSRVWDIGGMVEGFEVLRVVGEELERLERLERLGCGINLSRKSDVR